MFEDDFGGLEKRSHNFMFVCHHWFEVASHTPELWSFWGNTPEDWARWYPLCATAPLDLVLSGVDRERCFDRTLFNVLQDRVSRDAIRRIHLESGDSQLLETVLSSLTPRGEDTRSDRMKSLLLCNWNERPVDVSSFLAHHYFPKLQRLNLVRCTISSWDLLMSRTGALTELHLDFTNPSPTPTILQLFSILASNPDLQKVTLFHDAVPNDHADTSSFRAPLHRLKQLHLSGDLRRVFRLLQQLEYPATLDKLSVTLHNCPYASVSQIIGPHLRNYFRRRGRSPSGLGLSISCDDRIVFNVGEGGRIHLGSVQMDKVMALIIPLDQLPPTDPPGKVLLDLLAYIPQEDIVHFWGNSELVDIGGIYTQLPNLNKLHLNKIHLPAIFPGPNPSGNEGISLSLQTLVLRHLTVDDNDWSPLTTFLAYRTSSGKPLNTLVVSYSDHMCSKVVGRIEGMVQEFSVQEMDSWCPFGFCLEQ